MKALRVKSKCRNCGKTKMMDCDPGGADFAANDPYWRGYFYAIFADGEKYSCPAPFVFLNQCDCGEGGFILHDIISYRAV